MLRIGRWRFGLVLPFRYTLRGLASWLRWSWAWGMDRWGIECAGMDYARCWKVGPFVASRWPNVDMAVRRGRPRHCEAHDCWYYTTGCPLCGRKGGQQP